MVMVNAERHGSFYFLSCHGDKPHGAVAETCHLLCVTACIVHEGVCTSRGQSCEPMAAIVPVFGLATQ